MAHTTCDIAIIGAGPAGLHAARAAVDAGVRVCVIDENPEGGGQIWRRSAPGWARKLLVDPRVVFLHLSTVVEPGATDRSLRLLRGDVGSTLGFEKLIIAAGAREVFLPFPGWTLPGVFGAGGLQALCKSGLDVKGKRIVVAGSGPLLLAVAAHLRGRGARVSAILEQAAPSAVRGVAFALAGHPGKLFQAAILRASLARAPYWMGSWVTQAIGEGELRAVRVHRDGSRSPIEIPCDMLACGFGLTPNLQLPALLGCEIRAGGVVVDALQETTRKGIYAAGEQVGIGGVDTAVVEGRIAGLAAAGRTNDALALIAKKRKARRFAAVLARAFALRHELKSLGSDDTIVCRCEDVALGAIKRHGSWREAKLQTRCGMGPCQGRICGPIAKYLLGLDPVDSRPPISPTAIKALADA